jgi:tRNA modification GTPase
MFSHDTIAAIATPPGEGAVALVRLSGPEAIAIVAPLFQGRVPLSSMKPRHLYLGKIVDHDDVIDEVLLAIFQAPQSYTGEEMVEISCHGGSLISARLLEVILHAGARMARAGEFTQRAYLHGKMDLTQAEAVMDLIQAQTTRAQQVATEQLAGRLGKEIALLKADLLAAVAHLEAFIDFPEEDIAPETGRALQERLEKSRHHLLHLLARAPEGRLVREGLSLALCGAPNAGKSSLLNALLGRNRAIVTPIAGTTRDLLEEMASLGGFPFRLIDTAGLRETEELIEQEGIARTHQAMTSADLTLHLVDVTQLEHDFENLITPLQPQELLILNKIDLLTDDTALRAAYPEAVFLSCKTEEGMEELKTRIISRVTGTLPTMREQASSAFAINARHQACLQRALTSLNAVLELFEAEQPPELLAVELHAALQALGDVVGESNTEEILGEIFGNFCIGK